MNILNFSTLDRIQQLKENLAQKDKDIIKLDKQIKGIALEDGWLIEMSINITEPDPNKIIDEPAEPIVLHIAPRSFDLEEFENWLKITNNNFNLSPEMRLKLMLKNKTDK